MLGGTPPGLWYTTLLRHIHELSAADIENAAAQVDASADMVARATLERGLQAGRKLVRLRRWRNRSFFAGALTILVAILASTWFGQNVALLLGLGFACWFAAILVQIGSSAVGALNRNDLQALLLLLRTENEESANREDS